ncbi:Imidazolonepropionase [Sanguibacter gelidistatuariae]|uniref:Imidazolonepropionase n=1 Tax=Sanguibacter gelidistatuariae TaxID=1814289 RepID=A0A1G6JC33_9MICO|nr:amidohydrolase family protein [Sanguibacter gelidistatuariae]SDC15466.1 Imidazolonepropionase [Sanguibacter gelidistatuariae]
MSPLTAPVGLVVRGAHVMDADGAFSVARIEVSGGRIVAVERRPGAAGDERPGGSEIVEATGLWLIPGIVDCHTHLGWTTFLHDDEPEAGPGGDVRARRRALVAPALAATLRAGVTSARDAGGAEAELRDEVAAGVLPGPRLAVAVEIITAQASSGGADNGVEHLRERVRGLVARGADWIKLMATGGVMAAAGTELESAFSEEEIFAVVDEARVLGARVMVHAWGGPAVTHAIAAGAASIEHGIFLTREQAVAGAANGTVLVPTLAIYAEVAQMAERGELPSSVLDRVRRVVAAHPVAVRTAHEAGMRIVLGSDYGTTDQHGRNLTEIDHLARAGLGARHALLAATRNGAELLGGGSGLLEVGEVFDAVLLDADPRDTGIFLRPDAVVAVYQDGQKVR